VVEGRAASLVQRERDLADAEADFGARTAALARRERELEASEQVKEETFTKLHRRELELLERERVLAEVGGGAERPVQHRDLPPKFLDGLAALEQASEARRRPSG
jgi:hypothetical protein